LCCDPLAIALTAAASARRTATADCREVGVHANSWRRPCSSPARSSRPVPRSFRTTLWSRLKRARWAGGGGERWLRLYSCPLDEAGARLAAQSAGGRITSRRPELGRRWRTAAAVHGQKASLVGRVRVLRFSPTIRTVDHDHRNPFKPGDIVIARAMEKQSRYVGWLTNAPRSGELDPVRCHRPASQKHVFCTEKLSTAPKFGRRTLRFFPSSALKCTHEFSICTWSIDASRRPTPCKVHARAGEPSRHRKHTWSHRRPPFAGVDVSFRRFGGAISGGHMQNRY
jgi:hypothetical protein